MSAAAEAGVPGAFVELAGRLADAAGPILKRHYRSGGAIQYKADASPCLGRRPRVGSRHA